MFKKLFSSLTQSKEEKYLDVLETDALSLSESGSVQSAAILRSLAKLKKEIDDRIDSRDRSLLQIDDFADLAQSICEGLQAKIKELAALERKLPNLITARDGQQFEAHNREWRDCLATILRGYATLHHAATGERPTDIESLPGAKAINPAMDSLELQIRTAERIRNELG